jgi:hypothetical protein
MVYRPRKAQGFIVTLMAVITFCVAIIIQDGTWRATLDDLITSYVDDVKTTLQPTGSAVDQLQKLAVKGKAPKTGYERSQFGTGWSVSDGCDTRNLILRRDLVQIMPTEGCIVSSGVLLDPYTNTSILFVRGAETSDSVQIDHVVSLSNAWQTGAQFLSHDRRKQLANDPLGLLAVSGVANQRKSDGDAATWLPSNISYRCSYVARQIAVKFKYALWVTDAEHDAMIRVLQNCPHHLPPLQ